MEYKLEATIPCVQYGNIRPSYTIQDGDDEEKALDSIRNLWDKYGEKPLTENKVVDKSDDKGELIDTYTGEQLYYNDDTHVYTDLDGKVMKSGSVYAGDVTPKFNKGMMVTKTAKAWDVEESVLDKIWSTSGDVATSYGTSAHNALESYHENHEVGAKIQEQKELDFNYALPKNTHIREIVESFVAQFGTEAEVEVLVSDVKNGMAGQIDRLQILDKKKKVCRVGDYKFVAEMDKKKLLKYQHQLSFYSHIMISHGWTVEGIDLFHHDGQWNLIQLEVLDLVE